MKNLNKLNRSQLEEEERSRLELYLQCIEVRNFEIGNLVSRNNFFMIFQGVLIAGALQASNSARPIVIFLACILGVAISLLQTMMASGAKFWQEAWEHHLENSEKRLELVLREIDPDRSFYRLFMRGRIPTDLKIKARLRRDPSQRNTRHLVRRFSVSKVPIYAGLIFTAYWLLAAALLVKGPFSHSFASLLASFPTK